MGYIEYKSNPLYGIMAQLRHIGGAMSKAHERYCQMPEVTFSTFVLSLASAALVGLGEVPDPATGRTSRDFPLVRHNIDVLEMLRQKTQGHLEQDEEHLLTNVLCELRLKYVIISDSACCCRTA